jgi:hypothetical protein
MVLDVLEDAVGVLEGPAGTTDMILGLTEPMVGFWLKLGVDTASEGGYMHVKTILAYEIAHLCGRGNCNRVSLGGLGRFQYA